MKKMLLSIAALAAFALPAAAHSEECRAQATGRFAKCGTPGAVPASQYVKKNGQAGKAMPGKAAAAKPAAAPMAAAPAAKAGGPCKDSHGKFIKCGTAAAAAPAAKPAAPAAAAKPAATPAKAAGAKKAPCKDSKGKFIKCAA